MALKINRFLSVFMVDGWTETNQTNVLDAAQAVADSLGWERGAWSVTVGTGVPKAYHYPVAHRRHHIDYDTGPPPMPRVNEIDPGDPVGFIIPPNR